MNEFLFFSAIQWCHLVYSLHMVSFLNPFFHWWPFRFFHWWLYTRYYKQYHGSNIQRTLLDWFSLDMYVKMGKLDHKLKLFLFLKISTLFFTLIKHWSKQKYKIQNYVTIHWKFDKHLPLANPYRWECWIKWQWYFPRTDWTHLYFWQLYISDAFLHVFIKLMNCFLNIKCDGFKMIVLGGFKLHFLGNY